MNAKENIDYVLLSVIKYFKRSQMKNLVVNFDNTPNDRLLFEIIKENYNTFDNIYIKCDLPKYYVLFSNILDDKQKDKFTFIDKNILQTNNEKTDYIISAKSELYCKSFLKFNYDNSDLYPLFGYVEEEINEMLKCYNINIDELNKEQYGLPDDKLALFKDYLSKTNEYVENTKDYKEIISYLRLQRNLNTKLLPSLVEMQMMEKLM